MHQQSGKGGCTMKWFLDLTTRAKLFVGFGAIILLLVLVVLAAYSGISGIERSQKNLFEVEFDTAVRIKDVRANQNGVRAATLTMVLTADPSIRRLMRQEISERGDAIEKDMETIAGKLRNNPALFPKVEKYNEIRKAYREARDEQVLPLINAGRLDEAKKLALGIQAERNNEMREIAGKLIDETYKNARRELSDSEERAARLVKTFITVGGVAVFLGIIM